MRQANGMGSVFKLSGKRRRPWAVRITSGWTDDGKQKFKYLSYHEKKSEALRALAEFNVNPYDVDANKVTFEEIYSKWSERAYPTLSNSSVKTYKSAYKNTEKIQKIPFRDIKLNALQSVVDAVESQSMARMTKFLFQKMYKYALENDIVEKDYSQFIKLEKKKEKKEKSVFSPAEIQTMWDNVGVVEYADLIVILLYTGMRIGELLDMTRENIHLEERYMVGGNKTDNGKNRVIPLHEKIVPLIENRMKSDSEYLFTNTIGKKLTYTLFMGKYWGMILAHLENKEITPHSCRHSFISRMARLNVKPLVVKRIVGHSNASITDHYTHLDLDELLDAIDMFEYDK